MFQFPAFALPALYIQAGVTAGHAAGFPHSEIYGSTPVCRLPVAYRRLPRPSSPLDAKTSTVHPSSLDHVYRSPSPRAVGTAATAIARRHGPVPRSHRKGARLVTPASTRDRPTHRCTARTPASAGGESATHKKTLRDKTIHLEKSSAPGLAPGGFHILANADEGTPVELDPIVRVPSKRYQEIVGRPSAGVAAGVSRSRYGA